jgi:hypothetical protein
LGLAPVPNEKRQYKRAFFKETVNARRVTESKSGNVFEVQGTPLVVRSKNISEGGVCLELGDEARPQMILKLNFQVGKKKEVDVYAKVVWADKRLSGLQFIVLDDSIRRAIRQLVEAAS